MLIKHSRCGKRQDVVVKFIMLLSLYGDLLSEKNRILLSVLLVNETV